MNKFKSKKNSGFTMVELLVTATIIALLAAGGLVSYTSANTRARNAKRKSDVEQVRAALELYRSENPCYPGDGSCGTVSDWDDMVSELESNDYLSNSQNISDPKASPHPQYSYEVGGGSCSGYEICATLEDDPEYCLCNP